MGSVSASSSSSSSRILKMQKKPFHLTDEAVFTRRTSDEISLRTLFLRLVSFFSVRMALLCSLSLWSSPLVDSHLLVVLSLPGLMRCNTMVSVGKLLARMYQSKRNHSQSAASTRTQRAVKLDAHCAFESLPSIWCRDCHPSEIYSKNMRIEGNSV